MEKVLYLLERNPDVDEVVFIEQLSATTAEVIAEAGGCGIQLNVVDDAVAPAAGLRFVTGNHPPNAMVSVWLPTAIDEFRAPIDMAIHGLGERVSACLVTESQPIINKLEVSPTGRTPGFAQLAFLHRPQRLNVDEWLDQWLNHHTRIAIETQSTFGYTQNIVTRWLFGEARYDAIVEELFPEPAMSDPHSFYDAVGDDGLLRRNRATMMDSVARFVDLNRIDVIATSQFQVRSASSG